MCHRLVILLALLLAACGGGGAAPVTQEPTGPTETPAPSPTPAPTATPEPTALPRGYVSRETLGAAWPLTVEAGRMDCGRAKAVVFIEAETGRYYAVNLPAKGQAARLGLNDIDEITAPGGDVAPLITAGLALCP